MIIHKGKRYRIECNGDIVVKTDGRDVRTMRYFPERDVSALAGEIDELTAWRIFMDISRQSLTVKTPISPRHILIDGEGFVLSEWSESMDRRLSAPEGYEPVWALAASVFQIFLGCHVFQGRGGKGQSATTPIPTLRRELPELSGFISRCLSYNPVQRPSLKEIAEIAECNILRCKASMTEFPPLKPSKPQAVAMDEIDRYWPDEIC